MLKKAFGKTLKKLRKEKGQTQEQLSEKVGMNARQISKLETGSHFPTGKNLEKICKALNVEPWQLFLFGMDGKPIIIDGIPHTNTNNLITQIENLAEDKEFYEFIQTAMGALHNNEDLAKLETMISGIKLGRQ